MGRTPDLFLRICDRCEACSKPLAPDDREGLVGHAQRGGDVLRRVRRGEEPIVMRMEHRSAPRHFRTETLLAAQAGIVHKAQERNGWGAGGEHCVAIFLSGCDQAVHQHRSRAA